MNSTSGGQVQVEPILRVTCAEKRGSIERSVYPVQLTLDNLKIMWREFSKFRTILGHEVHGDFWKFISLFVTLKEGQEAESRGLYWRVDDFVGMFYITDFSAGEDAFLHYTFFDRVMKGRQDLIVRMLDYIFTRYEFHRVSVEIPLYASPYTFVAAENLGFMKEGRKRQSRMFDGKLFDVNYYGMLRSEFYSRYKEELNRNG